MKQMWRRVVMLGSAGLVCGGLGTAMVQKALAREDRDRRPIELKVDNDPPKRDGRLATSYAPVVQKAAPAVVNIFTTKTVRNPHAGRMMPFMDDPSFRRFFGPQNPGPMAPRSFKQRSLGSGVLISADGYLLTNDHVVEGADEIKVALEKSREKYLAKVVGRDPKTDLAVLKIDAKDLPFVTLANSDLVEVGDVVLAIGNPFNVGQTVTLGIVSATGRGNMGIEDYEDFIQTDAAINPGNSGGALVDAEGRLIGINTAIVSGSGASAGIGFAIPANLARSVMDQLISNGSVSRGFLGVGIQDLNAELAAEFEVEPGQGVLVTEVNPDSAADSAGLRKGDIILEFNGRSVADARSLRLAVGQVKPGDTAPLKLLRDGKEKTVKVTLKSAPGEEARPDGSADSGPARDEGALEGVGVGDLTPALRREYRVPAGIEGAVIYQVDEDSASARAGLQPGDVIQEINRKPVRSSAEAIEACRNSKGGRTLVQFWRQNSHRYVVVNEKPAAK